MLCPQLFERYATLNLNHPKNLTLCDETAAMINLQREMTL